MKLLNNYLSAVAMTATSEAILLGVKYKIDMKKNFRCAKCFDWKK